MPDIKRFKSTSGKPERIIANTCVAIVGTDWTILPPLWHREAYAAGCISEDMVEKTLEERVDPNVTKSLTKVALKREKIRDTILSWLQNNEVDNFYKPYRAKNYLPRLKNLSEAIGERVFKGEAEQIWYKLLEDGIDLPEFK